MGVALQFELDVAGIFSGSGIVSIRFKAQGKEVYSNDYIGLSSIFTKTLVENNQYKLTENDLDLILTMDVEIDNYVPIKF
ncbi:DNA adenine methylase [Gracilibacillus sp. JCM 18860]|uniref:DNA adenine methylase n=1 Tax=Gracilibacillus sp. JCM 18860 TaxID=1306159 RepID=UPI0006D10962